MGCGNSKPKNLEKSKSENINTNSEQGLYTLYVNDELLVQYCNEVPKTPYIMFIKPKSKVQAGSMRKPAEILCQVSSIKVFHKGVMRALLMGLPTYEKIHVVPDASKIAYKPFKLVFHELGNGIIGDSLKVIGDGQTLECGTYYDAIAIVPGDTTLFDDSPQSLEEFIKNVTICDGHLVKVDPSGKVRTM